MSKAAGRSHLATGRLLRTSLQKQVVGMVKARNNVSRSLTRLACTSNMEMVTDTVSVSDSSIPEPVRNHETKAVPAIDRQVNQWSG